MLRRLAAARAADPWAATSCTSAAATSSPIHLEEADVRRLHRCAAGAHVVFIGTSGLQSMVMRGKLTNSVLNQSFALHGVRTSYIAVMSPINTSSYSNMMEAHFDEIGGPSACVIIKYSVAWVGAACRRRGALVLVDSIDQYRAYSEATLNNEHYRAMDAIIVQTEFHAAMVAKWGHVAVLLPHPHGNLRSWSVADTVRERVRGVGFTMQDSKNMPTNYDMHQILRATCRANTTLYLVAAKSGGLDIKPYTHRNCSNGVWEDGGGRSARQLPTWPSSPSPCLARTGGVGVRNGGGGGGSSSSSFNHTRRQHGNGGGGGSIATKWASSGNHLEAMADPTNQRRYYDTPSLLDMIDVAVVWRPGHQQGGKIAIDNRPPTRLHWWWSHGIPVIGYPMQAYVDAARRVGYPEELLNLTTSESVELALRKVEAAEERSCLQRIAHRGADLSSPWYTSIELLAAICQLGERCAASMQHEGSRWRQQQHEHANAMAAAEDGGGGSGAHSGHHHGHHNVEGAS